MALRGCARSLAFASEPGRRLPVPVYGGSCFRTEEGVINEGSLPHQKLVAYQVALELLRRIYATPIRDAEQREQARKSAKSAARNIAEAGGRWSRADKARIYAIARGEVCEACAAVEIAAVIGCASEEDVAVVNGLGKRLSDILGRLVG